ncbi:hypothetical protein [Kitasatospora sp. McL0602]|uniref:hypothetical protein n=1 Tax=Kitasatospora sp. McL0602 TaxID=3439530 RepID=UPI003F8C2FDC
MAGKQRNPRTPKLLRAVAEAHIEYAHIKHDRGESAHKQIGTANRANQWAADTERSGAAEPDPDPFAL